MAGAVARRYCPGCYIDFDGDFAVCPGEPGVKDSACGTQRPSTGWGTLPIRLDGDKYILTDRIGGGGMGAVFAARSRSGDECAVKILKALPGLDKEELHRQIDAFRNEALKLGQISRHPQEGHRFTRFIQELTTGEPYFFVMERVEWPTLARVRSPNGHPPRHVALLGIELARALLLLEVEGVVHCDLKPGNLFVDGAAWVDPATMAREVAIFRAEEQARAEGKVPPAPSPSPTWVKVSDFGCWQPVGRDEHTILRVRAEDRALTASFASPEQIVRDELIRASDARARKAPAGTNRVAVPGRLPPGAPAITCASDIHAVGTILYQLATGKNPYPDRTGGGRKALLVRAPAHPSLPDDLYAILADALDPKPENRPTARELIERLRAFLVAYEAMVEPLCERVRQLEGRAAAIRHAVGAADGSGMELGTLKAAVDRISWPERQGSIARLERTVAGAAERLDAVDGREERDALALRLAEAEEKARATGETLEKAQKRAVEQERGRTRARAWAMAGWGTAATLLVGLGGGWGYTLVHRAPAAAASVRGPDVPAERVAQGPMDVAAHPAGGGTGGASAGGVATPSEPVAPDPAATSGGDPGKNTIAGVAAGEAGGSVGGIAGDPTGAAAGGGTLPPKEPTSGRKKPAQPEPAMVTRYKFVCEGWDLTLQCGKRSARHDDEVSLSNFPAGKCTVTGYEVSETKPKVVTFDVASGRSDVCAW